RATPLGGDEFVVLCVGLSDPRPDADIAIRIECVVFNPTASTAIYTLSLHDALPISPSPICSSSLYGPTTAPGRSLAAGSSTVARSEEHTSELQSRRDVVCRPLLEKKKRQRLARAVVVGGGARRVRAGREHGEPGGVE